MLDSRRSFRPTKLLVAVSLCCGSVLAAPTPAAAACQAGDAGCVLPVGRTAPPPPPATQAPPPSTAPIYEEDGGGINWLLIALGLAALAAAIYFLVINDDDEPDSP
jgi:hypothetical protein